MVLATEELDELDIRLLDALQRNARSTFAELGSVVGLKAPAVHDRVKRLEQRGYIQRYSVQLNYMTTDAKARSELRRHRLSAFVKRLTRAA